MLFNEYCFLGTFLAGITVHLDFTSVAEPVEVEPKLFGDLEPEPEPKIYFNQHFLQSVWRMPE